VLQFLVVSPLIALACRDPLGTPRMAAGLS
jgi:hypothetical protein